MDECLTFNKGSIEDGEVEAGVDAPGGRNFGDSSREGALDGLTVD